MSELKCARLGACTVPHTISYLDNGFVVLGSVFGNSQVVKLHTTRQPSTTGGQGRGSYVEVVEEMDNLGSIQDMCLLRRGSGIKSIFSSGSVCGAAAAAVGWGAYAVCWCVLFSRVPRLSHPLVCRLITCATLISHPLHLSKPSINTSIYQPVT